MAAVVVEAVAEAMEEAVAAEVAAAMAGAVVAEVEVEVEVVTVVDMAAVEAAAMATAAVTVAAVVRAPDTLAVPHPPRDAAAPTRSQATITVYTVPANPATIAACMSAANQAMTNALTKPF